MTLKSLHLFHVFGNFAPFNNTVEFLTSSGTPFSLVIAPGDYDADTLVDYLYSAFDAESGVKMSYDPIQNKFHWTPAIKFTDKTTCFKELGLPGSNTTTGYTESPLLVNLSGVSRVEVMTNLTLNTIPMGGTLAILPVTAKFGDMIEYRDYYGAYPLVCMDQSLGMLKISLWDQDARPLSDYIPTGDYYDDYVPGWEVTLAFESYGDPGWSDSLPQLVNGATADLTQLPEPGKTFVRQEYTGTPTANIVPLVTSGNVTLHRES